jgi:hypothetical protein
MLPNLVGNVLDWKAIRAKLKEINREDIFLIEDSADTLTYTEDSDISTISFYASHVITACGTGGMLTMGKEWILGNINPNIEIKTSGQELNPQTYSICKSDMLISGENPDNIKLGSSLSEDGFQGNRCFSRPQKEDQGQGLCWWGSFRYFTIRRSTVSE